LAAAYCFGIFGWLQEGTGGNANQMNTNPRVDAVLLVIQRSYSDRSISLKQLSQTIGTSEEYLGRLFARDAGRPFRKYLLDLRMTKAKELLRQPEGNIKAVAAAIGFREVSYFGYVFRKYTTVTPKQFRATLLVEEHATAAGPMSMRAGK
jgi:two-component system response regulator YesN